MRAALTSPRPHAWPQAYGGHGYIKDNKAEQVYRDVRIASLWEGTTQIQVLMPQASGLGARG